MWRFSWINNLSRKISINTCLSHCVLGTRRYCPAVTLHRLQDPSTDLHCRYPVKKPNKRFYLMWLQCVSWSLHHKKSLFKEESWKWPIGHPLPLHSLATLQILIFEDLSKKIGFKLINLPHIQIYLFVVDINKTEKP